MEVVEDGPVVVDEAERIPGEDVAAVIADGLDGRERAKQHALAGRELGNLPREYKAEDIEEKGFEPVSVDGAVCVRHIETMMLCVHGPCVKMVQSRSGRGVRYERTYDIVFCSNGKVDV